MPTCSTTSLTRVTEHFSVEEFACKDGTPYPSEWVENRLKPLCETLEILRAALGGRQMTVTSGYRTREHNIEIGGAEHSQHLEGKAADIEVEGVSPGDVHTRALELFAGRKIPALGGLGVYPNWVHVDIRPRISGLLALWTGDKVGSERVA